MNIVYVHTGKFPSNSPSFTFASNTVNSLAKVTEHCHYFIKKNSRQPAEEIYQEYLGEKIEDNLVVHPIKVILNANYNHLYFYQVYKKILQISKSQQIDLIITRNVGFLKTLVKIKKQLDCQVYLETHDFFSDLSLREDLKKNKKLKQSRLERKYLPRIDGLICLMQSQIDLYRKYYPELHFILARTGLNPLSVSKVAKRKYLGYVGSLDPHKGIINMFKIAAMTNSKPELLIIGAKNENEVKRTLDYADKYYTSAKVKVLKWLNKRDLYDQLDQFKFGFVTLQNTFFNRYLTSPLKVFDYYSKNIPIIATQLPTLGELIDHEKTGFLYHSGSEIKAAKYIDHINSDAALYNDLLTNIEVKKHELTWDNRALEILKGISRQEE